MLGQQMFDRSKRRISLTNFGEVFLRYASASLSALEEGMEAVRDGPESQTIRIGALPTVSASVLPRAVQLFSASSWAATPRIITGPNDYLLEMLRTGDLDVVIGRMADADVSTGLSFEHLYSEQVVLAVRPGHPLLKMPFSVRMLEQYQTLAPSPDMVIHRAAQQILLTLGVSTLRNRIETISNDFGRAYVRQSDSIWIISAGVVAHDVAEGQLMLLPLDTRESLCPVGITTLAAIKLSLASVMFLDAVRKVCSLPNSFSLNQTATPCHPVN